VGTLVDVSAGVGALVGALVVAGTFVVAGTVVAAGGLVGVCAVGDSAHAASSAISRALSAASAVRRSTTGRRNIYIIGLPPEHHLCMWDSALFRCGGSAHNPYVTCRNYYAI
jgi:hypothetical protein